MNIGQTFILLCFFFGVVASCGCQSDNKKFFDAIREQNISQVQDILARGNVDLDPPSQIHQVNKPLAYAAAYGNLEIVKLLVDAGADLDGQVAYGDVPLNKADEHGNDDIIEYLIREGANVNAPNFFGVTPFIGFCAGGQMKLIELSTNYGADLNGFFKATVGNGAGTSNFSPIQAAVSRGSLEAVEFLLAKGADASTTNSGGRTLIQIAKAGNHMEVIALLESKK